MRIAIVFQPGVAPCWLHPASGEGKKKHRTTVTRLPQLGLLGLPWLRGWGVWFSSFPVPATLTSLSLPVCARSCARKLKGAFLSSLQVCAGRLHSAGVFNVLQSPGEVFHRCAPCWQHPSSVLYP